jgi:hypothetical protein
MRKSILCFTFGFFAAVALAAVVLLVLSGADGGRYDIHMAEPSPDGKHIATVYTGMGGGAAGWCSSYVSVSTEDKRNDITKGQRNYETVVFDGSCNTKPIIQWENDRTLIVKYQGPKDRGGIRVYKCPMSNDNQVTVVFIEI